MGVGIVRVVAGIDGGKAVIDRNNISPQFQTVVFDRQNH